METSATSVTKEDIMQETVPTKAMVVDAEVVSETAFPVEIRDISLEIAHMGEVADVTAAVMEAEEAEIRSAISVEA